MTTRLAPLLLVAALVLAGCGDDDGASSTTTTTSEAPGGTVAEGPAVDEDALDACEDLAADAAPEQAALSFPDNPDVTWAVGEVAADPASGLVQAEVTPTPDEVGYPAFRLLSICEGGEVELLGAYALDGGTWVLLFTTDARSEIDLAPELG